MAFEQQSKPDRQAIEQKLEARAEQWRAEIDRLEAKAREAQADRKMELDDEAKQLRSKVDDAERTLKEMRESSGDAWDELRHGAERAWDELDAAFRRGQSKFR